VYGQWYYAIYNNGSSTKTGSLSISLYEITIQDYNNDPGTDFIFIIIIFSLFFCVIV